MRMRKLNICYFPTTIVLVDDSNKFLDELRLNIVDEYPCIFFDNPNKALDFINNKYKFDSIINHALLTEDENLIESQSIAGLNVRKIHKELYNADRFSQISLMFVDYSMPGLDGVELCEQINNQYIKRVLLTGEASAELAVSAFNEGIINKFILKTEKNALDHVLQAVKVLQNNYFASLTEIALSKKSNNQILSILEDENYIELFNKVCVEHNIVEYYLLDEQGSYLLLDRNKKPIFLIVKSENEMNDLQRYAEFEEVSETIIRELKNRQKLPFFYTDEDLNTPPEKWGNFLYQTKLLKGKETYFYSIIDDYSKIKVEINNVVSFGEYLEKT